MITRLDAPRADFEETVALCQRVFGEGGDACRCTCRAADDGAVAGWSACCPSASSTTPSGSRVERDPDPEHVPLIEEARGRLIEAIIAESEDESLLERYLSGDDLDPAVLVADLETAVGRGHFHPVVPVCGGGSSGRLRAERAAGPDRAGLSHPARARARWPVRRRSGRPPTTLSCDPAGPLAAEVVRTWIDPYLGRVSLARVFSGTLHRRQPAARLRPRRARTRGPHPDHDADEKVGALPPLGPTLAP